MQYRLFSTRIFFCLFVGANVHQLLFVVFLNESCQFISRECLLMYLIQSCRKYAFYTVVKTFIFSSLDRCLLLRILWRVFEFVIISTFLCIIHVVALLHDPSYCFYGSSFLFSALMWYLFFLPWIIYNLLVFSMGHVTHSTWCILPLSDKRDKLVPGGCDGSSEVVHSLLKNAT